MTPSVPVTEQLINGLENNGIPIENRMRFACVYSEHQGAQWSGGTRDKGRWGLVDHAVEALALTKGRDNLPDSGIRSVCRWFAQHGSKACAACPEIIRRPEE